MSQLNPYLTFNGNCREAMHFYQECLGGELVLQTIGDAPMSDKIPEEMKRYILHASLSSNAVVLMASDMVGEKGLTPGNTVSLLLSCDSESDMRNYYTKLSDGGEQTHPIELTHWGALFGDLTDRYGNQWLLHFQK
jgi:PhnB protein